MSFREKYLDRDADTPTQQENILNLYKNVVHIPLTDKIEHEHMELTDRAAVQLLMVDTDHCLFEINVKPDLIVLALKTLIVEEEVLAVEWGAKSRMLGMSINVREEMENFPTKRKPFKKEDL